LKKQQTTTTTTTTNNKVPRNLFERELWLSSTGSSDWYEKQGCYARSLALMSVIGYLLGLGDRHLDNILLDFSTGEVCCSFYFLLYLISCGYL
jgi:phosphatidylinositol kinase/protein kinase (PI-3  family)